MEEWRPLRDEERLLLEFMLARDAPGFDVLREQLKTCEAQSVNSNESILLRTACSTRAVTRGYPQAEVDFRNAQGSESTGMLSLENGTLWYLEFYAHDGSAVDQIPHPSNVKVYVPDS